LWSTIVNQPAAERLSCTVMPPTMAAIIVAASHTPRAMKARGFPTGSS
jgi:hypothetical protein